MANIAILGYGIVGGGVRAVLADNAADITARLGESVSVTRILDLRDFPGDTCEHLITHDFADILEDGSITAVAETMGGLEPANTFVAALLEKGVSVATSNKELVAVHGPRLLRIAAEHGCRFLFEASVCGGIPVISCLSSNIGAERITGITGILNGTTNYILSKMEREGVSFETALAEAQRMGYAEKNPEADVEGHDARRKIAILAAIAGGYHVDDALIPTEGISGVASADFVYADRMNMSIKLLASYRPEGDGAACLVAPHFVPREDLFAATGGVFNAVKITGSGLDDILLYGKGAGKMPTGSAVVSDLLAAVGGSGGKHIRTPGEERRAVSEGGAGQIPRFVRLAADDQMKAAAAVKSVCGAFEPSIMAIGEARGEIGVKLNGISNAVLEGKLRELLDTGAITAVRTRYRIYI